MCVKVRIYGAFCVLLCKNEVCANCGHAMSTKISVLLDDDEAARFDAFCTNQGYKKSTLIVRLIKEHLNKEGFPLQGSLLSAGTRADGHAVKRKSNS
jgi:hypothetical protein